MESLKKLILVLILLVALPFMLVGFVALYVTRFLQGGWEIAQTLDEALADWIYSGK